jgi:peptidyl-prolyl isomerase D
MIIAAKALYRRAIARAIKKEDDDAERDLTEATRLVPGDQTIKAELAKVQQRRKVTREKQKQAFKKMFG